VFSSIFARLKVLDWRHYAIAMVLLLAAFAPHVPELKTLLPGPVYAAIASACGFALYLTQSPLTKPLFPNLVVTASRLPEAPRAAAKITTIPPPANNEPS